MIEPTWLERARAFRADDPDPTTRAELDTLFERLARDPRDDAALRERFSSRLEFGTAGLRGLLGAGDNRMNRRVVAQTTAGLCAYLDEVVPDARRRGVCLGFDGRHGSREFAEEVRAVATGAGFLVLGFEEPGPTPLLAYAVLKHAAACGVMITASHNPAAYNGFKVYLHDGIQLGEPHDRAIASRIDAVGPVLALPRLPLAAARAARLWRALDTTQAEYLAELEAALGAAPEPLGLRVAYTAMHGVGEVLARASLQLAGVADLLSVSEQARPDPDFPTVAFPNPEEHGAMDRVLALAESAGADLALANDPDADRLAVAARAGDRSLRTLTGNELGVLLTDYLLRRAPADGRNLIVSTIVSSPLAERVARKHGAHFALTLTGFKWIMRRARELSERDELRFVLGFEEALGYCIGDAVRDKDGIAAAAHVARMTAWHAGAHGHTLYQALEQLYRRHGLFGSKQLSIATRDAAEPMRRLRAQPPAAIAGLAVTQLDDLLQPNSPLPPSDVLRFILEGEQRVMVRPSGTEPKLKIYLDCTCALAPGEALAPARARVRALIERIAAGISALLRP